MNEDGEEDVEGEGEDEDDDDEDPMDVDDPEEKEYNPKEKHQMNHRGYVSPYQLHAVYFNEMGELIEKYQPQILIRHSIHYKTLNAYLLKLSNNLKGENSRTMFTLDLQNVNLDWENQLILSSYGKMRIDLVYNNGIIKVHKLKIISISKKRDTYLYLFAILKHINELVHHYATPTTFKTMTYTTIKIIPSLNEKFRSGELWQSIMDDEENILHIDITPKIPQAQEIPIFDSQFI